MGQAVEPTNFSGQECLALERVSDERYEYVASEIFAIVWETGCITWHLGTSSGEIRAALSERGCAVHSFDVRILLLAPRHYVYPNSSVVPGDAPLEYYEDDKLLIPKVIVEVFPRSTDPYHRGNKFEKYQCLASLREDVH